MDEPSNLSFNLPVVAVDDDASPMSSSDNWTLIFSSGSIRDVELQSLQQFFDIVALYFIPSVAFFGILTNVIFVIILLRTSTRSQLPCSPFLMHLAVIDITYLIAVVIQWSHDSLAANVLDLKGVCQMTNFVHCVATFLSVWLLVCLQGQSYIGMWHISRSHTSNANKKMKFVACSLTLLGLLLYSGLIWMVGNSEIEKGIKI